MVFPNKYWFGLINFTSLVSNFCARKLILTIVILAKLKKGQILRYMTMAFNLIIYYAKFRVEVLNDYKVPSKLYLQWTAGLTHRWMVYGWCLI